MFPFLRYLLRFLLFIFVSKRYNLNFEEICRRAHTYCTVDKFKYRITFYVRHWELININPEDLQEEKKGEFCVEAQAERLHADRTLKRRQAGR